MKLLKHKLIHEFLEQSAEDLPNKVAIVHENIRATYAEINAKANQIAAWLLSKGIQHGDRVVIILENSLEYVISYYGILKSGAVAVPLSTDLKPDGLNPLIAELEPFALISNQKYKRLLKATDQSLLERLKILITPINSANSTKPQNNANLDLRINSSDLSSIIYTSGSTGKPKGVMLTHANIVSNTDSICHYLKINENDIQMVILPFFYVMGKSLLNTHFAKAGPVFHHIEVNIGLQAKGV